MHGLASSQAGVTILSLQAWKLGSSLGDDAWRDQEHALEYEGGELREEMGWKLLSFFLPLLSVFMASDLVSMFFHYYSCFCNILPEDYSVWFIMFNREKQDSNNYHCAGAWLFDYIFPLFPYPHAVFRAQPRP